jgi:hypothetical protein
MIDATLEKVSEGREAFARHEWERAYELLRAADADTRLEAGDLERLAEAARWSRHYSEMLDAFERAEAAYERGRDCRGAARVALALAWEHFIRNDDAVATGWHGRAATLLEDDTESAEYTCW